MQTLNSEQVKQVSGGELTTSFIILSGSSPEALMQSVLAMTKSGYELYGDPFSGSWGYLYQAMTKEINTI